jgi:hypothetical protein
MRGRIALLLGCTLLLAACGGGSSSNNGNGSSGASSPSIAGNWQMSLQKAGTTTTPKTQSGSLTQDKDAVGGQMLFTGPLCRGVGNVTGSVTGNDVSLALGLTGLTVNLTGSLASDQASMSGTYTILASGCQGSTTDPQETGAWTANMVKPLTGSFQGNFTSTRLGTSFPVMGQLTQAANNGSSNIGLSGNFAISGYCFDSANVVGLVSGTGAVLNLVDPNGIQIGQIVGNTALDGTSLTGTYNILPGAGTVAPCIQGESGTVSLTL